jgi:hypothetical protein
MEGTIDLDRKGRALRSTVHGLMSDRASSIEKFSKTGFWLSNLGKFILYRISPF